jgi:F-type H+-transporting ATPase subunit delta
MATAVANRYARALAELVFATGAPIKPEDAVAQLRLVDGVLTESWELRNAMLTPAIQASRKRAVMGKLLESHGVSHLVRNFVFVVIDHRRVGAMSDIREAFDAIVDERLGFIRAEVTSAEPLGDRRRGEIDAELSRLTGKRMRLRFTEDSGLLGGVLARIGSTIYDGSLRGQLQVLRRKLTEQSAE